MTLSISFLGGVGTVTGSRSLLDRRGRRVLVDCGLFQGLKQLRLRNWAKFPVDPASVDAVLLTHAHLDHSGYLPALVRDGFRGRVHAPQATIDLCEILLKDSGFLQEKDAEYANKHGFSRHKPAAPLYTLKDAKAALLHLRAVPFHERHSLPDGPEILLRRAGHILGAASIVCRWGGASIAFSGDLGRFGDPVMVAPEAVPEADYVVVESTYGNRLHEKRDPQDALAEIVNRTVARGGTVVIPAFAVGCAQSLLYHLEHLVSSGRISGAPVFLDSPMAINATELLHRHNGDHRLTPEECARACNVAQYVRGVEESKALTSNPMPKVVVSASGMATGGRVLHHLKRYAPDKRNTILFSGFQAAGTRGADMLDGADRIKIHGEYIPVRAEVANLPMLSAHADSDEIVKWLGSFRRPPKMTFISHGEPEASDALRRRIQDDLGWPCRVPEHLEKVVLE
ncbi:MAG: MBL fold metallo-hydrolase [Pseudaminobacter sp.]|jgi:metallo-beta-lactamase family protein|uniref:Metallo-beta-lactamase family protein n=1 Tax=Aquamicrobium defluvii TaxID=69279 RepID=A0A011VHL3_9HYPH|nr:MBL fold metallo-hydrolase [Aquamicrobium defluvii]EXL07890.1 mRNA 3'-end processing factor [Aquamicrobium defluvii]EZQ14937.1 mRNA 3'-end processing factor [Halopseudomonas bauzanensis]TDR34904.1 metallo-beta-lactamase family protein [Aquamicrobium defluvii]